MKINIVKTFQPVLSGANLTRRLDWLILMRWIAGTSVLISVLAGKAFFHIEKVNIPLLLGIWILLYNAIFLVINRSINHVDSIPEENKPHHVLFINVQIFFDLFTLAFLIYYTGGILNPFLFFFVFHMVIGSILLSRANAYTLALLTILLESLFFVLEHYKWIKTIDFFGFYPENFPTAGPHALLLLAAFSATMIITVYFTTSIVASIRRKHLELTELQKDLQEQKNQLELKNLELEELDHSKTEFLHRVEHELKAPIEAVNSLLSIVSRGYTSVSEEKKADFVKRAVNRVLSMKDLVSDLLSLSQIKERSFKLDRTEVNGHQVVSDIVMELNNLAVKKGIAIQVEIEAGLPDVTVDEDAFRDIVKNLIHNAVKYSFEGTVNVSMFVRNESIVLQVKDRGIGIDAGDLEKIGNEFFRAGNAKAFEEGTGLGLSLVKRLVEKHGGKLEIQSRLNQGSTFTVSLPRVSNYFSAL